MKPTRMTDQDNFQSNNLLLMFRTCDSCNSHKFVNSSLKYKSGLFLHESIMHQDGKI